LILEGVEFLSNKIDRAVLKSYLNCKAFWLDWILTWAGLDFRRFWVFFSLDSTIHDEQQSVYPIEFI